MHDTTCGPALVDIAAMRDVLAEHGVDPKRLTPRIPVDVSTDHSSAVDVFAQPDALRRNLEKEFGRNAERYRLMKWASAALPGIRVHPPGSGIMHTINLERLSQVVVAKDGWAYPDAMIGTDSHTPMINGLGILAWGVGGLEAEGALFGVPVTLRIPDVVGVKLTGWMRPGTMATDLALAVTETLRKVGVTGDFVEFFGPGVSTLSVGVRACVANMAPEYGASTGYFPIDAATLDYCRQVGRTTEHIRLIETYAQAAGLWFDPAAMPVFTRTVDIDLSAITPSVAGPRRPQDRMSAGKTGSIVADGPVAIAAITSCTNTSDPRMLVAAGLLARKARALGLTPPPHVKTSLAPGSPTAETMLRRAGVLDDLAAVGFDIVGYGCTTCIGNSGALTPQAAAMVASGHKPVAVLSGNRNFPGRVHSDLDLGFLASPPMVIAFALAGTVSLDIERDAIAHTADGRAVRLADLWPSEAEIDTALAAALDPADFAKSYDEAAANPLWLSLASPSGERFPWDAASTYLRRPPFAQVGAPSPLAGPAAPLLVLGDDMTTDHISPAGAIPRASAAARWLVEHDENPDDLNVFASRRGNFEVMLRGAFTNRLARNLLTPDAPAGITVCEPGGDLLPLPEAAARYAAAGVPVVIVAGERYGMGSSRDWAAKAVALLGVRAVIAASFERIHRTNLIGMGILPLEMPQGVTPQSLATHPDDRFDFPSVAITQPRQMLDVELRRSTGKTETMRLRAAVETSLEIALLGAGGLIPHVLAGLLKRDAA